MEHLAGGGLEGQAGDALRQEDIRLPQPVWPGFQIRQVPSAAVGQIQNRGPNIPSNLATSLDRDRGELRWNVRSRASTRTRKGTGSPNWNVGTTSTSVMTRRGSAARGSLPLKAAAAGSGCGSTASSATAESRRTGKGDDCRRLARLA